MKKRGFGGNWWNGFGGKLAKGESFKDSARRETQEECGLTVSDLRPATYLLFYFEDSLDIVSLAYISEKFTGQEQETEEMRPQWFKSDQLPYDSMWPGDEKWIPQALELQADDEPLAFAIYFDKNNAFQRIEPRKPVEVSEYFKESK
jgi:8-oxo-dGTP pyrophosphatase MutT (NUDIX family)